MQAGRRWRRGRQEAAAARPARGHVRERAERSYFRLQIGCKGQRWKLGQCRQVALAASIGAVPMMCCETGMTRTAE